MLAAQFENTPYDLQNRPIPALQSDEVSLLDYAARRSSTIGRCRRFATKLTFNVNRAPRRPRTSTAGRAHDERRGHFLRGSNRGFRHAGKMSR